LAASPGLCRRITRLSRLRPSGGPLRPARPVGGRIAAAPARMRPDAIAAAAMRRYTSGVSEAELELLRHVAETLDRVDKRLESIAANTKPPHPVQRVLEFIGLGVTILGGVAAVDQIGRWFRWW